MKNGMIAGWTASVAAVIIVFQGLNHFRIPYVLAELPELSALPDGVSDMFILLWLCIGILLLNLGFLAFYFRGKLIMGNTVARVFFLCAGILYAARTVIEMIYPFRVPEPNPVVLPTIALVCLLLLVSWFLAPRTETG